MKRASWWRKGVERGLYIGGEGLARGYLRRAELTAEKFVPDGLSGRRAEAITGQAIWGGGGETGI